MSFIANAIGLITVERTLTSSTLHFQRILKGVVTIIGLTVITAMMGGVLLIGGFYALYHTLLRTGFEPSVAASITAGSVALLTLCLVMMVLRSLHTLRGMPADVATCEVPFTTRLGGIADAFLDGLMARAPRK